MYENVLWKKTNLSSVFLLPELDSFLSSFFDDGSVVSSAPFLLVFSVSSSSSASSPFFDAAAEGVEDLFSPPLLASMTVEFFVESFPFFSFLSVFALCET